MRDALYLVQEESEEEGMRMRNIEQRRKRTIGIVTRETQKVRLQFPILIISTKMTKIESSAAPLEIIASGSSRPKIRPSGSASSTRS